MIPDVCLNCGKTFTEKWQTPWSICYDPSYKTNVWGGDSHEYIGYLCGRCGRKFDKRAKRLEVKNGVN